jgi:hypothetical protein
MSVRKCARCGEKNFLSLSSRACEGNYYQWNDRKEMSGYMAKFSTITENDGCNFTICVECGWIVGLDLQKLKHDIIKAYDEDESVSGDSFPKRKKHKS